MKRDWSDRETLLGRIEGFHGHLGPYVILGFRAGKLALARLGAKGHFDLEAKVWSGTKPPLSCFADGIQLGSGCTTGKGNLSVAPAGAGLDAVVEFKTRVATGPVGSGAAGGSQPAGEPALRIRVRPDLAGKAGKWLAEYGDRGAADRILDLSDEDLFEVRP